MLAPGLSTLSSFEVCLCSVSEVNNCVWLEQGTKEPLEMRLENHASILTAVTVLKTLPYVPVNLSQHNQMLGCQEGVLLSQPHFLVLLPTSFLPPCHISNCSA